MKKNHNLINRNGIWHIQISVDGKRYTRSTRIKCKSPSTEVKNARNIAVANPRKFKELCTNPKRDKTLKNYVTIHLSNSRNHAGAKTIRIMMRHLVDKFKNRDMDDISPADVVGWKRKMESEGFASATINQRLNYASTLFCRAIEEGYVENNPFKKNRASRCPVNKKKTRIIQHDEERKMRSNLPEWMIPVFALGIYAGLRLSELSSLRHSWVDLGDGSIKIPVSETKAGRSARTRGHAVDGVRPIVLDFSTLAEIKKVNRFRSHEYFFSGPNFEPATSDQIYRAFVDAVRLSGIGPDENGEKITPHSMRRTAATRLILRGMNYGTVQEMMGWSSASMIDVYKGVNLDNVRSAVSRLSSNVV
jgi:integrase